jgi:tRNA1Val (adenine37-N6)-methyltransferase
VCNPPFFINSYKPPKKKRATARHTDSLTHQELLECVTKSLKPSGRFCLILPTIEGELFQTLALRFHLYVNLKTAFFSRKEKTQERWLLEFSFEEQPIQLNMLLLYDLKDNWSAHYKELTKDFYLDKLSGL